MLDSSRETIYELSVTNIEIGVCLVSFFRLCIWAYKSRYALCISVYALEKKGTVNTRSQHRYMSQPKCIRHRNWRHEGEEATKNMHQNTYMWVHGKGRRRSSRWIREVGGKRSIKALGLLFKCWRTMHARALYTERERSTWLYFFFSVSCMIAVLLALAQTIRNTFSPRSFVLSTFYHSFFSSIVIAFYQRTNRSRPKKK